jgi:tyrosine--tRNA ligase
MEAKKQLGAEVVKIYYGEEAAKEARDWFENVFSKRNLNVDLPEVELEYKEVGIIDLLVKETGLMKTTSEARRLIQQGGFKINDEPIKDVKATVVLESGMIVRAGKKKIVKVK